jgi:hypothetical protein
METREEFLTDHLNQKNNVHSSALLYIFSVVFTWERTDFIHMASTSIKIFSAILFWLRVALASTRGSPGARVIPTAC